MDIYDPLNQSLHHVGATMNAAETHGILCALLCLKKTPLEELWFKHVFGEMAINDHLAQACEKQLLLLKNYTQAQLKSDDMIFTLLLPNDEEILTERIQALGGWCEGFLFGLGLCGKDILTTFAQSSQEFIQDMVHISRIAPLEVPTEEEEANFLELLEYVKVGVLTLYEEQA